jgi:hypothetical protein
VINFGFPGVLERPMAADMDRDGIDDLGLWVPGSSGGVAEWYFLVSNDPAGANRVTGSINTLNHEFSPTPLGSDVFAKLGDQFSIPLVGNFDPPLVKAPTVPLDTAALYDPATGVFFLQDENAAGPAAQFFQYGPAGAGWTPLDGDWNNDGVDTVGLYNPATGMFYLRNSNTAGIADIQFQFGPGGGEWQPLVGDWNNDGLDTVGLYNAVSGVFFLTNSNAAGAADLVFGYGVGGAGWRPLVGDWDNDGIDTVGVYVPASGNFFLRNAHAGGVADVSFSYGPGGLGWTPLIGDWDQDGDDNAGLYSPGGSVFFLKNEHTGGLADQVFSYGPAGAGWTAMAGAWTAPFGHALRLSGEVVEADGAAALSSQVLQPVVDAAIASWATAGLDAARLSQLRSVEVVVTDLPGNYLGWAEHGVIYLDRDAAGAGWHIDATPDADEEFVPDGDRLSAVDANLAAEDVDLLTVLAHELGHELGLADLDGPAAGDDLMTESLRSGQRRLPTSALVDRAFSELGR